MPLRHCCHYFSIASILAFTLLIVTTGVTRNVFAQGSGETQLATSNTAGYLGVRVDLLPEELVAQLPEDVLIGQGILVTGFADNSTAPKQGLKKYDIILSYDGHPVMHPREFITAIKNDRPGRTVQLQVARKGKLLTLPIKLSSQQYPLTPEQLDYQYNMQVMGYDGLKIKQYSEDDFEAAIRYLAPDGIVRSRTFTGPYNKVFQEIYAAPDIPDLAKQHLIKELSHRKKQEEGWFGKWIPFNDGNFSPDSIKHFGL